MARPSKQEQLQKIHAEALAEFDDIWAAVQNEREQAREDRRFYSIAGAQWDGAMGELFEARPRFEFNRVHLAVIRCVNEYRNNRVTVDFTPKDGSSEQDELADTCDGLYRADEAACSAQEAYDNAYEEQVSGGMGAWRLRADYEDEEDEDNDAQRIKIEPIFDAESSVFFNLDARRQDKADARRCWVLTPYTHAKFREEFGHDPATWPRDVYSYEFEWVTPDIVWVCEHYRIEERTEMVYVFEGVAGDQMKVTEAELKDDPAMMGELLATGFRMVKEKRVKRKEVRKYLLSGAKTEEDCGVIPGKHIPIVVTYGKRWVVDGIERFMGHVRLAKDAQRLSNMLMSWLADMASRFDVEKPIFTPEQVQGHATAWARDAIDRNAYLLVNAVTDPATGQKVAQGPIGKTSAPQVPPVMAALIQLAEQALSEILGAQERGEELQANISGKAVELIQTRLDMQTFIYMSNFAKGMKRSGEIWLAMKKDITVEKARRMKVIGRDGKSGSVVVNELVYDTKAGTEVVKNDLARADFEPEVEVGPSSSSTRAATVRGLTGLLTITQDPETQQALTLATIANIEGEGLQDTREWARARALKLGIVKPTEDEQRRMAEEQANAQPSPQDTYLQAAAEQAQADAALKRAGTVERIASADLKKAQTAETWAKALGEEQAQQIASVDMLRGLLAPPEPASGGFGASSVQDI